MERKAIEKLLAVIESGMEELADKVARTNRIDPSEIDILKKAICVKAMLEDEMNGEGYSSRSYDGGQSYRRGRNHETGQFMSRDSGESSRNENSYEESSRHSREGSFSLGRSGHSASDRLMALIEDFGERGGDAERQAASRFLQQLR